MRTVNQRKASTRNHQLMLLAGMITNINSMERQCASISIKDHIDKVRNSIHKLQSAIFRSETKDWIEQPW